MTSSAEGTKSEAEGSVSSLFIQQEKEEIRLGPCSAGTLREYSMKDPTL